MEILKGATCAPKAAAKAGVVPGADVDHLIAEALKGLHYAHTRLDHGKPWRSSTAMSLPHNIPIAFGDEDLGLWHRQGRRACLQRHHRNGQRQSSPI